MPQKIKSTELPISEITLRKYEKPSKNLSKRNLIKKILLSLGLLQPGDSREVIIDIFQAIIESKKPLSASEIIKKAKKARKDNNGLTYPNVSRQLRRLKSIMLIESRADKYRLNENDTLQNIFKEKIIKYYITSIEERINEYLMMVSR